MSDTQKSALRSHPHLRLFAIAFAAITVLLIAGYILLTRYDFEPLYSGLDIEDAALITAELDRQEIRYRVGENGGSVLVPSQDIGPVRLALYNADGLGQNLTGFELFNESEMGLTDFAQKIKFQRAIQGELSRTIMMMDGVKSSRVHVAIPERSVFRSQKAEPKAAVILVAEAGADFTADRVLGIQRLVSASIPELTRGNVIIVDGLGRVLSAPPSEPDLPSVVFTPEINPDVVIRAELKPVSTDAEAVAVETSVVTLDIDAAALPPAMDLTGPTRDGSIPAGMNQAFQPTTYPFPKLIAAVIGLLLSVGLVVLVFRRRQLRLSAEQRADFATELSLALNAQNGGRAS